eukprot:CAMPEP_0119101966 /NCGR_PEP_ID=MMETSP1180-20130426/856_2 /TAXON_ID=3052 ORGANISM="Chlamydomonas cf sp, Strain CCMP681" /NCGR_SAMPLE_ID=MMETSP1180 /ASSEMBLY_ACC=CAM_ASM_000741 /LENGTH=61 /DNA_ID=CAMNT_0007086163 /DNA_START=1396 /DNA_END=1577 /DNA_ORIENTATION=-
MVCLESSAASNAKKGPSGAVGRSSSTDESSRFRRGKPVGSGRHSGPLLLGPDSCSSKTSPA